MANLEGTGLRMTILPSMTYGTVMVVMVLFGLFAEGQYSLRHVPKYLEGLARERLELEGQDRVAMRYE